MSVNALPAPHTSDKLRTGLVYKFALAEHGPLQPIDNAWLTALPTNSDSMALSLSAWISALPTLTFMETLTHGTACTVAQQIHYTPLPTPLTECAKVLASLSSSTEEDA